MKKNMLPPGLVNNLQEVLSKKAGNNNNAEKQKDDSTETSTSSAACDENDSSKPVVFVTNGEGVDSLGLVYLVQALVGTPVDCVSLALSGALFSWSKPLLVISGINRGTSCGHHMYNSGVVAGAREALISGVPSLSLSLNWKKEESQESDFKEAVSVSLPLISAAIRDIEKGVFPKSCFLSIEIPTSPSANKGFKLTKQSMWRPTLCWQAVSANRRPSATHFMSNQQNLGLQLAQLGRDASAAGAARRGTTQGKNEEVESVGAAKSDTRVKKYFRLEFLDKEMKDTTGDLDFNALSDGFIAVTPLSVSPQLESDIQMAASTWISGVTSGGGEQ
ncbi:hypothetical protein like AT1G72880 [Hibiscus trionum]|uniref:Survival protein SurE-like phosphatase/nucleotidase domain-containing protein n=1 Tax=Hibiscus trionum TaxID=183268 RepID=A0A9W7MW57_HIBTR|nr:hypothetical protein like AT1G72880 [Hibiscus trionum]